MNWEKFDLHLENLIPGIIILFLFLYISSGPSIEMKFIQNNEVGQVTIFIATAYLVGVIANIVSRMLVDTASKRHARERVFNFFLSEKIERLKEDLENDPIIENRKDFNIHEAYSSAIDSAMTCGVPEIISELTKRRQTGRLVRSSLIPGCLIVYSIGVTTSHTRIAISLIPLFYITIIFIYAFSECTTFQEALRGQRIEKKLSSKPK